MRRLELKASMRPKEDENIVTNREKEIQYFVQYILYDSISGRYLNTGKAIGT